MKFLSTLSILSLPLIAMASDVIDLTSGSFKSEIGEEPLALVEFFAPWCGHCKNLAPHYEEAATELKTNHNIKLAKVDCTEQAELCQEHGVQGYPTLKVFKSGVPSDYSGPRKADGIISYMVKQSLPALSVVSTNKHDLFKDSDRVVVLAYFPSESAVPASFKAVAESLRDSFLFGYTTDLTLSPTPGSPAIVVYKKFDEGSAVYSTTPLASASFTSLSEFIKENSVPVLDQVSPENFASYADQGLPLAYIFTKPEWTGLDALLETVKPIARKAKGKVNFVWIDALKFEEHGKSLGLATTTADPYPAFVIQDLSDKGKKYVLSESVGADLSAAAIETFVTDFEDGKLAPTLKSQEIPATQEPGTSYQLVGKSWDSVVLDEKKDVFVALTASWCGHCQRLAPIWESLAEHFEEFNDSLVIAKMDATENDLPVSASFEVAGFPTIKFKRAGTTEFLTYEGDRSLESLIEYVMESSANPIEFAPESDAEEEAEKIDLGAVEEEAPASHHDEL